MCVGGGGGGGEGWLVGWCGGCGVVWCGVVWCGVVWCGVVWCGVVCCVCVLCCVLCCVVLCCVVLCCVVLCVVLCCVVLCVVVWCACGGADGVCLSIRGSECTELWGPCPCGHAPPALHQCAGPQKKNPPQFITTLSMIEAEEPQLSDGQLSPDAAWTWHRRPPPNPTLAPVEAQRRARP